MSVIFDSIHLRLIKLEILKDNLLKTPTRMNLLSKNSLYEKYYKSKHLYIIKCNSI